MEFYTLLTPVDAVRDMQRSVLRTLADRWPEHIHTSFIHSSDEGSPDGESKQMPLGGPIVGVHVRVHDEAYDWGVVTPAYVGSSSSNLNEDTLHYTTQQATHDTGSRPQSVSASALRFDDSTPLPSIMLAMGDVLKEHPTARFFVASNSASVKDAILAHFNTPPATTHHSQNSTPPDAVIGLYVPHSEGRGNTYAMQVALLELSLLGGMSDLILHSKGSSFAVEAAYFPRLVDRHWQTHTPNPLCPSSEAERGRRNQDNSKYHPNTASSTLNVDVDTHMDMTGTGSRGQGVSSRFPVPVVDVYAVSTQALGAVSVSPRDLLPDGRIRLNMYTTDRCLVQCGVADFLNNGPGHRRGDKIETDTEQTRHSSRTLDENGNDVGGSTDDNLVCYNESPEDSTSQSNARTVCSHRYRMHECKPMQQVWGLQHLYCALPEGSLTSTALHNDNGSVGSEHITSGHHHREPVKVVGLPESLYVLLDISGYSASTG